MGCSSSVSGGGEAAGERLVPGSALLQEPHCAASALELLGTFLGPSWRCWSVATQLDPGAVRGFGSKALRHLGDAVDRKLSLGYACRKGLKPENPNQDAFMALHVEGNFSLYGVFDGHGKEGHAVSDFVKEQLPKLILSSGRCRPAEMRSKLQECFEKVQHMLVAATQLRHLNARVSGTTATIVLHDHRERRLTVAHAGDSGACLGQIQPDTSRGFSARPLTKDHKPNVEEERARIERAGGRVLFDGYANHRVYTKTSRLPGLNMSRSLGDLLGASQAGISSDPTISDYQLGPEDHVLLLCSDGVWEFTSPRRAVEAVLQFEPESAMEAADRLARNAWDSWILEEGGVVVDDITALVVFLPVAQNAHEAKHTKAPASVLSKADDVVLTQVLSAARPLVIGRSPER